MRAFLASTALLASMLPAAASGGLDCTAEDKNAEFAVAGGVTRGMGGPLFSFNGELTIKDKAVAADLQKITFEREHVAQYWFDGDGLSLDIYRERDADKVHGYVELIIKTKSVGDEGEFKGTYELMTWDGVEEGGANPKETSYKGKVSCFTE